MQKLVSIQKIYFVFCILALHAREEDEVAHVKEGNLALRTSQQPCPLFCFGQNIVDKGDLQLFGFVNYLNAQRAQFIDVMPNVLYGIRDDLSIFAGMPFAARYERGAAHSSGIEDMFVQVEYAFYNKDRPTYANQLTVVANMTVPTGSKNKNPATGLGVPSFFFGLTANHMGRDWYLFLAPAINYAPRKHDNFSFIYQGGLGRNVMYIPEKLVVTLVAELLGATGSLNKIRGSTSSSADTLSIGPSLWVATPRFIFNVGVIVPLVRNKNTPDRANYLFAADVGWTFNT